jgi:hypothetical protein
MFKKGDGVHPITAVVADNSCIGKSSRTGVRRKKLLQGRPEGVFLWV